MLATPSSTLRIAFQQFAGQAVKDATQLVRQIEIDTRALASFQIADGGLTHTDSHGEFHLLLVAEAHQAGIADWSALTAT